MHKLHYTLDHARRLVQGADSPLHEGMSSVAKQQLMDIAKRLRSTADSVPLTITEQAVSARALAGLHDKVDSMLRDVEVLHHAAEVGFQRWRRRHEVRAALVAVARADLTPTPRPLRRQIVDIPAGSKLPWSLIVPVCIDAALDGVLVGFATAAAPSAGIILGVANVVEMSFVGVSLAIAVARCSGSPLWARRAAVIVPPILLVIAGAAGAWGGAAAHAIPPLFVGIIAFGMVGLVFLVTSELLVAGLEALEGEECWWCSIQVFVGIAVVLLLSRLIE